MVKCTKCKQLKQRKDFHKCKGNPNGLQAKCKTCVKSYDKDRYKYPNGKKRKGNDKYKQEKQLFVYRYLETHPCVDCGEKNLLVLEFDHLRDKDMDIADLITGYSLAKIKKEIEKCEVVCSNCHKIRTHTRANTSKFRYVTKLT